MNSLQSDDKPIEETDQVVPTSNLFGINDSWCPCIVIFYCCVILPIVKI